MPRHTPIDEKIHARDLFVRQGWQLDDIAESQHIHITTLRRWSRQEKWEIQRAKIKSTPIGIAERLTVLTARLLDEIDEKLENNQHVGDDLLKRIDKLSNSINRLDGQYDERGSTVRAIDKLIKYCIAQNHKDAINALHDILPHFYKSTFN